jgi:6-phosphogluconolactonase/glucosamine-6-phosphate isomerase/deaminase
MAKNIMFLVTGGNKAKIVKDVIEGKNNLLPAAMVEPEKGELFFLLDERAGSLLKFNT